MGLYYSTDMVLRWYKADDSQLKQDRGRTQYTAISNDALVDLREHGITEDNVRQWLEENHVPPDGYTSPYDGTISDNALAEMTKSTADARAVTRAYSLLGDEGDDEQEKLYPLVLSNAIPALHEFRKLFVPEETKEQHVWRLRNLCPDMPLVIAEYYGYKDEAISMLCGHFSRQSNYLAAGYVLSCIWADVEANVPDEVVKAAEFSSRAYKSEKRKQQGDNISVHIPWYDNSLGQYYAANALVKFAKDILAGLKYYRRKGVDGNSEIYTYPGAWREVISTYESANAGPRWETADEMLLNITSYTSKYMKLALDDYINLHMKDITYNYDSRGKKKRLMSPTLDAMLYAAIVNEQTNNVCYRKCLLCNRYFQLSNHVTRRYCDVHRGPNAKYYRKRIEEVKKQQTEEIVKMLMNQLGNKGAP